MAGKLKLLLLIGGLLFVLGACADDAADPAPASATAVESPTTTIGATTTTSSPSSTAPQPTVPPAGTPIGEPEREPRLGTPRPSWLGTRIVPLDADLNGISQPTPIELVDRQFHTQDLLPPPLDDGFHATVSAVPVDVVARSTWTEDCPVTLDELSYLTVSFYGFDGLFHTGELIVNADWTDEVIEIFRALHTDRFPIEQMQVVTQAMDDALATGDGNNTSSFTCRTSVGDRAWSMHAFGLAIDINPFHNPYEKGDLILPELATAYADRSEPLTGMLFQDSTAVSEFEAIGWTWGGNWNTLKDYMHFSSNGR
jgi:hypothetical protein